MAYESLEASPRYLAPGYRDVLERRLTSGYERDGVAIPSINGPIDWCAHHRSFSYHLNSWDPITELLMGHSIYQDERYFEAARGFAYSWLETFQFSSFGIGPDPAELTAALGIMPWYDMAVGQRVYRLAYIADVMCRDSRYDEQDLYFMIRSLIFHLLVLSRDDFFSAHSNHGFYQSLGELAATRRFRDEPFFAERFQVAVARARAAVDQQFHPAGIHREHSPGYHYMVMGSLIEARASGLVDSEDLSERVRSFEEIFTWLIQPDGSILTFGDTDPRLFRSKIAPDRYTNPQLRYQLSNGLNGVRPASGLLALKNEGYVFARSDYPERPGDTWWYLAQMASFHSRVHKHADDLSFVWSDLGSQILVDPGRFAYAGKTEPGSELAREGFWYSDPKRVYVESTRAHNTVEIDGRSYDRKRKPYGSALKYAGEQQGLIVTESEIHQHRTVRHWRVLVMAPGSFLLVVDWLFDRTGLAHDFRQYFHFHPEWLLNPDSDGKACTRFIAHRENNGMRLAVVPLLADQGSLSSVRGQEEPELLGWVSDKAYSLIPCATIASQQFNTDYAVFATLFSFETDTRSVPKQTIVRRSMRPSVFAWEEAGELVRIEMRRGQGNEPVSIVMRRGDGTTKAAMNG
jgi:hypothetical protein